MFAIFTDAPPPLPPNPRLRATGSLPESVADLLEATRQEVAYLKALVVWLTQWQHALNESARTLYAGTYPNLTDPKFGGIDGINTTFGPLPFDVATNPDGTPVAVLTLAGIRFAYSPVNPPPPGHWTLVNNPTGRVAGVYVVIIPAPSLGQVFQFDLILSGVPT